MPDPKIAEKRPAVMDLPAGNHAWCACGESKNQPFCDGSHKTTPFRPIIFKTDEPKKVALCQCKHSAGKPYCDGTHKTLPVEG